MNRPQLTLRNQARLSPSALLLALATAVVAFAVASSIAYLLKKGLAPAPQPMIKGVDEPAESVFLPSNVTDPPPPVTAPSPIDPTEPAPEPPATNVPDPKELDRPVPPTVPDPKEIDRPATPPR